MTGVINNWNENYNDMKRMHGYNISMIINAE